MLNYVYSSIFDSPSDYYVNPVNCFGVMGSGLARVFKERYPENYLAYRSYCQNKLLKPGHLFIYKENDKHIINMATKYRWEDNSKIEWIRLGLEQLVFKYESSLTTPIAMPMIGTGKGKLQASEVLFEIHNYLLTTRLLVNLHFY